MLPDGDIKLTLGHIKFARKISNAVSIKPYNNFIKKVLDQTGELASEEAVVHVQNQPTSGTYLGLPKIAEKE